LKQNSFFLTFEGGDGAGKSTLIRAISSSLIANGYEVLTTCAPGGTQVGEVIRELILHPKEPLNNRCELLLFLADRAQHVETIIKPALEQGKIVLCDRYNDSTVAYQGGARGFDWDTVKQLCDFACRGLQPDLTLYLDLDPKIGLERVQKANETKDQIEAENISFHQKIRRAFHRIAEEEPTRFQILDASQSKKDVFDEAIKLVNERYSRANA